MNKNLNFVLKQITKLRYSLLWHHGRKCKYYDLLDILLIYLENVEITRIHIDSYNNDVTFLDGTILRFKSNDYGVWMNSGNINFSNGKSIEWYDKCPSHEILYKYKKLILNYKKSEENKRKEADKMKFNECLPLKYIRKAKLKNIKK